MRRMTWQALAVRPYLLHPRHLLAGSVREGERNHREEVCHHARQPDVEGGAARQTPVSARILFVWLQVESVSNIR